MRNGTQVTIPEPTFTVDWMWDGDTDEGDIYEFTLLMYGHKVLVKEIISTDIERAESEFRAMVAAKFRALLA